MTSNQTNMTHTPNVVIKTIRPSPARESTTEVFQCPHCTFINPKNATKCEMCEKTIDVNTHNNWECQKCTFLNKLEDDHCKICKEKKNSIPEVEEYYPITDSQKLLILEKQSICDQITLYKAELKNKIDQLNVVEQDLPYIRNRANLGVPLNELSEDQYRTQQDLTRTMMLQQCLNNEVFRLHNLIIELRKKQMEMS